MINHTIKIILKLFTSSILTLCILSLFLLFYDYVGIQTENKKKSTDYHWIPNGIRNQMTEGFSWNKIDSNGFNNLITFQEGNIDVLLLGSSHAEGFCVKQNETIITLLNHYVKPLNCYSIAIAGHQIYNCVNNLKNAYSIFKPQKYIIIEMWNMDLDSIKIANVVNNKHNPISILTGNKYVYFLQKYMPSARNLAKQIGFWVNNSKKIIIPNNSVTRNSRQNSSNDKDYLSNINIFLSIARKSVPNNIPIIIIYHPSYKLQSDGSIKNNTDKYYLETFAKACKNNDIIFIDTDNELQELYKTKHILPYGFINTAVCSGHLNKYGHEIIAKRLAKEILYLERRNYDTK